MNSDIKEICDRLLDGPAPPLPSAAEMVGLAARARRRRHAGFAVVGAGLAVVAVTLAAAAVPLVGPGTAPQGDFGAAPSTAAPAEPSPGGAAQSGRPPTPSSRDLGREVRPVEVSHVVTEMAARATQVQPLTIPDGQFLYVRTDGRQPSPARGPGTTGPQAGRVHEMWLDPQGMVALRIDIDGEDTSGAPKSNVEAEIAAARQEFAQNGASLRQPTPQFLATLPADPGALLRLVDGLNAGAKLGGKHYEFKEIGELFWQCGALFTPQVRAAFYRALGRIAGVSATELRVDGRRLYAVREPGTGRGFAEELLLDPSTGQAVGRRSLDTSGQATPTDLVLWRYAAVGTVYRQR
jgi:hypothetical protein